MLYLSTTNLVSDGHRACLPRKLRGVVGDYLDLICIRTLQAPVDITVHPGKWDVKLTMSRQIIATCKSLITTLKTRWFLLANNSSTELKWKVYYLICNANIQEISLHNKKCASKMHFLVIDTLSSFSDRIALLEFHEVINVFWSFLKPLFQWSFLKGGLMRFCRR